MVCVLQLKSGSQIIVQEYNEHVSVKSKENMKCLKNCPIRYMLGKSHTLLQWIICAIVADGSHVPNNRVDYPGCHGGEPAYVFANEYSIGYSNIGRRVQGIREDSNRLPWSQSISEPGRRLGTNPVVLRLGRFQPQVTPTG